jgi:hypothetical protein
VFGREFELALLLRALHHEIGCRALGLSVQQLQWKQQQQQRAVDAGIRVVISHASRDVLKSPCAPLVLLQTLACDSATARDAPFLRITAPNHAEFNYRVLHPCAHASFPWAPDFHSLHHVCCIHLVHQPVSALAAAVACADAHTTIIVEGNYHGGFTMQKPGLCLQGQNGAKISSSGSKNIISVTAARCSSLAAAAAWLAAISLTSPALASECSPLVTSWSRAAG